MNILIAEDEKDLRELLKINLEKENYRVLCAKDGQEALELFKTSKIDLAIFDIMMPVLDGLNLLRKVREFSNVPIILLTAKGEEMDKVLGFGLGADDYLVKPFSMAELVVRIAARLRGRQDNTMPSASHLIVVGDLTLDTDACCLFKNGVPIDLNAKEYLLIKLFMENPEKVFTKKQLYGAVWQDEYYYDDNTIMVHISRIRNKIEKDSNDKVYIKTIKGIGYKLTEGMKTL